MGMTGDRSVGLVPLSELLEKTLIHLIAGNWKHPLGGIGESVDRVGKTCLLPPGRTPPLGSIASARLSPLQVLDPGMPPDSTPINSILKCNCTKCKCPKIHFL